MEEQEQAAEETWKRIITRVSGLSDWLAATSLPVFKVTVPTLPSSARVVVIGAGLTGVSCAYWLRQYGASGDIVVLEQRSGFAHGATGRNGGHLWPSIEPPSEEQLAKGGAALMEELQQLFEFKKENFLLLCQFIEENGIDCDFIQNGSISLARTEADAEEERDYIDFMRKNSMDFGFEWWDAEKCRQELHTTKFVGGAYQKMAAKFYPAKVVHGIAEKVLSYGNASFHFNTQVTGIEPNPKDSQYKYTITTNTNERMQADIIIHATNAWAASLFAQVSKDKPYCLTTEIIKPTRGQAFVTSPIATPTTTPTTTAKEGLRWGPNLSFDDGWQYMIQRKDGKVVLGGMRWVSPTGEEYTLNDSELNCEISERLHQFLVENFDGLNEVSDASLLLQEETSGGKVNYIVEKEWTGIMAFTPDERPLIGPLPPILEGETTQAEIKDGLRIGQYIAAGYTGNGMALAFAAAKAIARMVVQDLKPEEFVKAFSPSRFSQ